jgi:hypothetical protein
VKGLARLFEPIVEIVGLSDPQKQRRYEFRWWEKANGPLVFDPISIEDDHGGGILDLESIGQCLLRADLYPHGNQVLVNHVNGGGIGIRNRIHLFAGASTRVEEIQHHALVLHSSH